MKSRTCLSALAIVLGTALTAEAAPVVDARVRALYAYRDRRGGTLPFYRARKSFEASGMAPLLVRFAREPSARELARYQKLGFERGRRLDSGAVKVSARPEALDAMEADGVLARVTVDLPPAFRIQPLDHARGELAVASGVAAWRRAHGTALTGEGVIIGDMDSSVDPFHPAFFRAGAPELWMDMDGDGVLTPGVDGVDRDQSGSVEAHEVLRLLDGVATDLFKHHERIYGTANTGFDPSWDYLFLDQNGDGKRNSGSEVAGADTLPSMGEPLFASDDVDRDGRIALPERIVPLGGSKFLALEQAGTIYRRGENLSQFKPDQDSRHGTLTMGCAAGGQSGLSRFLGSAPDAELLLTDVYSDLGFSWTDNLQWLVDAGADVVVTELSSFGLDPSDGSSELELLIDAVVEQRGVVVVSPAGNLGLSQKHAFATIPPASAPSPYQNELVFDEMPKAMAFSVTWREGQVALTGSLTIPDGDVIDLGTETAVSTTMQGRSFTVVHGVTSLGAGYLLFALDHEGTPLPETGSVIQLRTNGTTSANAALYAVDDVSGWSGGMGFLQYDVDGCMNSPAFASRTIAISAYALHVGDEFSLYPESAGELRAFSGRGPDLWGDPGIDVASPDNPVAATVDRYNAGVGEGLTTRWSEFGGTSGAGAVAAGVAALMRQANPDLSGVELRDAILAAARSDAQVQAGTQAEWGAGKLTLGGDHAGGTPPTAKLVAPKQAAPGHPVELVVELTDDGDASLARSRWDFGYDGVWDSDWQDGLTITTNMPDADHFDVKVEAMDADGWVAPAVVRVGKGEPPLVGVSDEDVDDGGCGCRVAGAPPRRMTGALVVAMLLAVLRRRRRA